MKMRLLRIFLILFILVSALRLTDWAGFTLYKTAYAVGDLAIDWGGGVLEGQPIFTITNMAPGNIQSHTVHVVNNASSNRPVGVRGIKTSETGGIGDVLNITIKEGTTTLYGPKTLTQFFVDSNGINGIPLSTLSPSTSTSYTFTVTFDSSAGNPYQGKSIVFDLKMGITVAIPAECENITFSGNPIFGTQGNDTLNGTNGNDLIVGFEGNDVINGGNGKDCIIGNEGNDILHGGNDKDVIVGGEGDDRIDGDNEEDILFGESGNDVINGGNDSDIIHGGAGNDRINGDNGRDTIFGEDGNDTITGGNDRDSIEGGAGNDDIDGGNDKDSILGQDGNDTMRGGNDNDSLLGGTGVDSARGDNGIDTCEAETKTTCEL